MSGIRARQFLAIFLLGLVITSAANAGGPLVVGGPGFGRNGQPFTWDPAAMPIKYWVDSGPMSRTPAGSVIVDNATGLNRVRAMFDVWQQAPSTSVSFQYAGSISATGAFSGGDVATAADFNAVKAACDEGTVSPIIFDADGRIADELGLPPDVIGFASPCKLDAQSGYIVSAFTLLNGKFQDGITQPPNYETDPSAFNDAVIHQLGHFAGLDHSALNGGFTYYCSYDGWLLERELSGIDGIPLMTPVQVCQRRTRRGLPTLTTDDQAWIAKLYPSQTYAAAYGTISGIILFTDRISHVQGANVVARVLDSGTTVRDESLVTAVSVVSGFLFTGNPGQDVTGDNTGGARTGSRNPALIGYYEIPVPAGTYTVSVCSVESTFTGESRVGPLDPPIPIRGNWCESWNSAESEFDYLVSGATPITVAAGQRVENVNIILNGTPPRFDWHEDNGVPPASGIRRFR